MRLAIVALCTAIAAPAGADTLVVLNKSDATASLIDTDSGDTVATLPTGTGPHEVAISPDGGTAVVANYGQRDPGNTLTVIDIAKAKVTATIDLGTHGRPHGVQYLPDGNCVVVTTEDSQSLLLVAIKQREVLAAMKTGARVSHMVVTTRDGARAFVSAIGSGSVAVFDVKKRKRIATVDTGGGAEGIDISPNGAEVWVSNRADDTVSVIDTESLEVVATLASAKFPIRVKFTPDGKHVLVSNAMSNEVAVFDAATRKELRRIAMGKDQDPIGILIPPDGKRAYIANTAADRITVIDLATWKVSGQLTAGKTPDGMGWSPATPTAD